MVYARVANTLQFASGGGPSSPTERMRIDSSGRVLIGTSTASGYSNRALTVNSLNNQDCALEIRSNPSHYGYLVFSDSSAADSNSYMGMLAYNHSANSLTINTNATTALTLDSSQNATFAGTITTAASSGALTIPSNGDIRISNGTWSGDFGGKIQHHDNYLYLQGGSNGLALRNSIGSRQVYFSDGGAFKPANTQTGYDLGSTSHPWDNVYADNVQDSKGDLRKIPVNAQTSAYTLVLADAGKCVTQTHSGGVNCPYNRFSSGDAITIINHSGSDISIVQGSSNTMYNSADGSTGNRTLAARGMATVFYQAHDLCYISGAGLS